MRQALKLHPDTPCSAAIQIEAEVAQPHPGELEISYFVTGNIDELRITPPTSATRTDELWQTPCFEAFIRPSTGTAYYEFNFAPSTQWAAYRFDSYRTGMRTTTDVVPPRIDVQTSGRLFTLRASLERDQ